MTQSLPARCEAGAHTAGLLPLMREIDALGGTPNPVDDVDRGAVTAFHAVQIKRIMSGDKTLGDNRDTIERAFADHRAFGYAEALIDVADVLARRGFTDNGDPAAPDLLACLQEYVRDYGDNEDADSQRMADKARAAIARATGQSEATHG